jgi:nucleoside-diphosphate-sugar epimerase
MKIAIIGCGYVGSAIARLWTQAGHWVTVTTTLSDRITELEPIAKRVVLIGGDNPSALADVVAGQEGILLSVGARHPHLYRETYLETAKNLVKALEEAPSVRQVIYTGSYAVLGDKKGQWVNENSPLTPVNENGEILSETEAVLLGARSASLKVCILRLAGIYGPGRELIQIFKNWSGTTRPGDGKDYTNWIHLDDIIRALEWIQMKQLDGVYHLVDDTPMTTKEFFDRLFACQGLPSISWDSSSPSIRPYNARLSNQKIKDTGYQFKHPATFPFA